MSRRRSRGSLVSARRNSRRTAFGVAAGRAAQSGSPFSTAAIVSDIVLPTNAARPVSIS